jgi:molybdate transport system substrate-binding protein
VSQIQNGAPFDVFFSADEAYPDQLERGGFAEPGSRYVYGIGRIVVWVRKDSRLDVSRGLRLLTDARVRKVSIANPDHAPYGRAAVAALKHEGLEAAVTPKFVLGENISQAAQFVQSGNAQAGIIALSLALAPNLRSLGDYWEIPDSFHPPLRQAAMIVRASGRKDAARRFLAFLQQPDISQLMQTFGFALPSGAVR